ncbi:MAG: hypothetical protein IKU04_02675 [Bacteroidales bacterium]|nr:hypothetical protein [Bacteroidales bacterium]MBR5704262.1 hypothetical protein [Bacteroidales bacterium]
MKLFRLISVLFIALLLASACDKEKEGSASKYKGLVINEISGHDESGDESWVEILNTGDFPVSLDGVGLYLTDRYSRDKCVWSAAGGELAAGERLVVSTKDDGLATGIISSAEFTLRLGTSDDSADEFLRSRDLEAIQYARGSYQRIPDGTGEWRNMTYPSKGKVNEVFDWHAPLPNAIWMWSTHMTPLLENDAAIMKEYWEKGYRHLLLHCNAFLNRDWEAKVFMDKAEEIGFTVHGWILAFSNGSTWNYPIDKETQTIKEEVFAEIINKGKVCIEGFGVKGLHLDYIRFGGSAEKYNFTKEVNSVAVVNRACREVRELCDSYNAGLVTSAALMPEKNSERYYAQTPSLMGKYIHILMPMCYRYSYNLSDEGIVNLMNWFCSNSADAEVWSGLTTYDKSTVGLTEEALMADIMAYRQSNATGIVLFRHGLGTFPNVSDIWNESN